MQPAFETSLASIFLGDCLEVLDEAVPDGSIDLVVTSPPYNLGVSSGGGLRGLGQRPGKWNGGKLAQGYGQHSDDMELADYINWQQKLLSALWSKLSDHGAIFYVVKPRVQNKELWTPMELNPGLPLRQIVVWARPGGINFSPSHFTPTYEWIMIFAKKKWQLRSKGISGKYGDVWRLAPARSKHPAPFPIEIPMRAIDASARVKTVLDPFCGSGTTLRAAIDAGLECVGIDNDPWCIDLCRERLAQMNLFFDT